MVDIIDNNGTEHAVAIARNGTVQQHAQDGYPDDPSQRTFAEDESVSQARRFARWHVYREEGYDTVPNPDNPDRLAAVLMAVLDLEDEAFDEYFGTLYEQMASHERSDVMPVLDIPDAVYNEEFIVYKQNVYLEEDLDTIQEQLQRPAVEVLGEDTIQELVDAQGQGLVAKARSLIGGGTDQTDDEFDPDVSFTDLTIADVSGLDTMYSEPDGYKTIEGEDPIDREPDARIETLPMGFTREQFRRHVGHILVCQIRDCFVSMGLEPPAQYRVLGHGKFKYSAKYRDFDFYPDYWDHEASISGYLSPV
ncbi:hypothetical protein C483_10616 [Natrialba hulunbeirensis JCM 10989]|uniref:Uncharacterized protein n=1 Tax=Natrialba hulunbeirensis JCM 10989 TaxID=1227493 RepID=L9ZYH3_9EURY|nr:hypothetical protein [Natrialba hulunbeirensis]ELY91131.1 hypothetical protein C483_10616 [Natrialba hulunbeirensis JCM 10989]